MYESLKVTVTDNGDPSVGLHATSWQVECPFCKEDADKAELESFREDIAKVYNQYANGRLFVEYDFEIKAREDMLR